MGRYLDGAGLFGGEGGLGEDVVVDEDGLPGKQLLQRLDVGAQLCQVADRGAPPLARGHSGGRGGRQGGDRDGGFLPLRHHRRRSLVRLATYYSSCPLHALAPRLHRNHGGGGAMNSRPTDTPTDR